MNRPVTLLLVLLVTFFTFSCKEEGPDPDGNMTKGQVLVNNPWRLKNVTDASGKTIPQNQLTLETMAIYFFDIQFFDNNVTKAIDRSSRQVVNGGTWYLIENDQVLDIEVSQFRGKFGVKELSRTRMTLTNDIPVNGTTQKANLLFEPVVQ